MTATNLQNTHGRQRSSRRLSSFSFARTFLSAAAFVLLSGSIGLAGITITDVGGVPLASGATGAGELSGLTWVSGNQFYAVSDNGARLFPLAVNLNPVTGAILSAALSNPVNLAAGTDIEGVAYNATTDTVYASDETGPAIREYNRTTGALLGALTVPGVYANIRTNYSLESLSLRPGASALWTANEEALSVDGPLSTVGAGTVVRLQKYDAALNPAGQWAYDTDGITGALLGQERSGVSDLVALPNGRLLVLERELGNAGFLQPPFRSRIYLVDFAGADDTSLINALNTVVYTSTSKQLLWEGAFLLDNFEGLALGPQLSGGAYSLLMISDDGGSVGGVSPNQSLYALTIELGDSLVAEPGVIPLFAAALLLGVARRRT